MHTRRYSRLPNTPAVFVVWADEGDPYLARTAVLSRRLMRLFGTSGRPSRLLNLTGVARRIEYWLERVAPGIEHSVL